MEKGPHDGHRARMKEQFLKNGLDFFESHQVLEMLLFYGIPRRDTNPLAHRLLQTFGTLPQVLEASKADLLQVEGMTDNAATLLIFCGKLLNRYHKEKTRNVVRFQTHNDIQEYVASQFVNLNYEQVLLVCLNNRGNLLHSEVISHGTECAAEMNARRIAQTALQCHATAVVVAHNHPGGHSLPSEDDVLTTRSLFLALRTLDISLLDHMIVTQQDCLSMRHTNRYAYLFA